MQRGSALSLLALCFLQQALGEVHHDGGMCVSDSRLQPITQDEIQKRTSALEGESAKMPELKKIFYINLPKSNFRRGRVSHLFESTSSVPVERFEAFSRKAAKAADLEEFTKHGIANYMSEVYKGDAMYGTIGVYLSHGTLLKKIMQENPDSDDMFLILEDDAIPENDWHSKLMQVMPQVPSDWDMIRIGYGTENNLRCEDKINDAIYENREPTRSADNAHGFYIGNQAYLVRPRSIPKILAQMSTMPVLDVDGTMISREGGMRVYGVSEPLVKHGNGMGLSNRMNPFSLAQTGEKEAMSLAQVIDDSVAQPAKQEPQTLNDQAFDAFLTDLP